MPKVFITDYIKNPDIEKKILGENVSTTDKNNAEVLLVWHENIDSNYLNQFPDLKVLIRYGVGCDNIDKDELKERDMILCNTPDYGIDEVSDTTVGMILSLTRSIHQYDFLAKKILDGTWQENIISNIKRSSDMSVGVIGAGRIGGSVLLKCKSMGFKVSFYDPFIERGLEKTLSVKRYDDLNSFLQNNDIISINATQTESSFNMVNEEFISNMKNESFMVNTARGKIVKDIDLFIDPIKKVSIKIFLIRILFTQDSLQIRLDLYNYHLYQILQTH